MSTDLRIRFDDSFDKLIDELRELPYFEDNASVAVFAASYGFSQNERLRRKRGSRDVRVNVLLGYPGALELMTSFALISALQDGETKIEDLDMVQKARLTEEYANGGLALLKQIRSTGQVMSVAIPSLINKHFLGTK